MSLDLHALIQGPTTQEETCVVCLSRTSMKRGRETECEKNIKREHANSGTRTRATRQNARDVRTQGTRSRNARQGWLEDALPSKAIVEIVQNAPQERVQQRASRKHVELDIMLAEHEMEIEEKLMGLKFWASES